jgi:hypothetical protein
MIWFLPGQVQNFRPDAILKEIWNIGDTGTCPSDILLCSILSATSAGGCSPVTINSHHVSNIIQTPVRNTQHIEVLGTGYNIATIKFKTSNLSTGIWTSLSSDIRWFSEINLYSILLSGQLSQYSDRLLGGRPRFKFQQCKIFPQCPDWAHPVYPMGTRGSFPRNKAAGVWSWPLFTYPPISVLPAVAHKQSAKASHVGQVTQQTCNLKLWYLELFKLLQDWNFCGCFTQKYLYVIFKIQEVS